MLSPEERQEIDAEIGRSAQRRGACIEALKVVQRHRGWVSDEALQDVASYLDMGPSELDGVATFYSLIYRRPVGRHVVLVCDSVSCWMLGSDAVHRALRAQLKLEDGDTTEDGRFTLLPVCCLGTCDHAPALMVDEDLHRDLEGPDLATRLSALLERYR